MANILLTYVPKERTLFNETISPKVIKIIANTLSNLGHKTLVYEYHPTKVSSFINKFQPECVFNIAYGYSCSAEGIFETQSDVAKHLENLYGASILGSSSDVQRFVQDKLACSRLLEQKKIKVPFHFDLNNFNFFSEKKVLIKPRFGACHRGIKIIESRSIDKLFFNKSTLIQQYIEGPEFTVGVIELDGKAVAFPPLEILFDSSEVNPVLGLSIKNISWKIDMKDRYELMPICQNIFKVLNLKHYARMDFRVSKEGAVCLDVNSMPNLDPKKSFLPIIAKLNGINYEKLIKMLVEAVLYI